MARKFLTAIDLTKLELQNAAIHNLAAAPSAPVKGQMYFDTVSNILYWWNGTTWVSAAGGSTITYGAVMSEATFGLNPNSGIQTAVSRADHTHGSPLHDNAAHAAVNLSALAPPIANISMGGFKINSLGAPVAATDATTKQYVDGMVNGLNWKAPVDVATTANITLSGTQTVDGVSVTGAPQMYVLVKNQTTASQNGIYTSATGAWTRRFDMNEDFEFPAAAVFVKSGTTQADTQWVCTNDVATVDATAINWAQVAGPGTITAGNGLTSSGNTINVVGDASITVAADSISRAALTGDVTAGAGANATTIAANAVTNAKLADMPTMTIKGNHLGATGDPIDMSGSQAATIFAGTFMRHFSTGCAAALTTVFNHGYATFDVMVTVYRTAAPRDDVEVDVERTDANNVTVRFAVAPAANEYTILVSG